MNLLFFGVLILFFVLLTLEFALQTSETSMQFESVGYGSQVDESFERDKRIFMALKKSFQSKREDQLRPYDDFQSETLNFRNGWRVTTDSPELADTTIYIYGGSTVLCIEVRDSETIASCLQRELNARGSQKVVANRGISGATVSGGLATFSDHEIQNGDVVIVYFGVNDAKLNRYCQKGKGVFRLVPQWVSVLGFLRIKLKSRLAQWIWLETVSLDSSAQQRISLNRAQELFHTLELWNSRVRSCGGRFIAVLQPHIWLKDRTDAEIKLSNRMASTTKEILFFQYKEFNQVLEDCQYFISIEACFRSIHDTTFVDWAHANNLGNATIAKALASVIYDKK